MFMNKLVFICIIFYYFILIIIVISLYEFLNVWKEKYCMGLFIVKCIVNVISMIIWWEVYSFFKN